MLVSEENGVVTGYASFWRLARLTVFHATVGRHFRFMFIRHFGEKFGAAAQPDLIDSPTYGKHVMVAGIESQNAAPIRIPSFAGIYRYRANAAGRRKRLAVG